MNNRKIAVFDKLFERGIKEGSLKSSCIFEEINKDAELLDYLPDFYDKCCENGIEIIEDSNVEEANLDNSELQPKSYDTTDDIYTSSVTTYLKEIGRYPILSFEEEQALGRLIKYGNSKEREDAIKQLVESNLRLVFSIAKRYSYYSGFEPLLDIVQNGSIGLMRAAKKFDFEKGFKFSTYATPWIHQSILRGQADNSRNIRIPVHMGTFINKVKRSITELEIKNGSKPSEQEVAEYLNVSVESVKDAILYSQDCVSLQAPVHEDNDNESELMDFIPDNSEKHFSDILLNEIAVKELIETAKKYLNSKELDIIMRRYGLIDGESRTLEAVAKHYGVTRERIRQIESKALKKIRWHYLKDRSLVE